MRASFINDLPIRGVSEAGLSQTHDSHYRAVCR